MNCFRKEKFVKVSEKNITDFFPLNKFKFIKYCLPTNEHPEGLIMKGYGEVIKKGSEILYIKKSIVYSAKTFKIIDQIIAETSLIIDKNDIGHYRTLKDGNDQVRTGGITEVTENSLTLIQSGSLYGDSNHYESLKLSVYKVNNNTTKSIRRDNITNKIISINMDFYYD